MTKLHARVARMAKHMNMVGGPGPFGPPLNPTLNRWQGWTKPKKVKKHCIRARAALRNQVFLKYNS